MSSNQRYCSHCNAPANIDDRFCGECGGSLIQPEMESNRPRATAHKTSHYARESFIPPPPPHDTESPHPPSPVPISEESTVIYAGFWRRFLAYFADLVILNIAVNILLIFVQPIFLYMPTVYDSWLVQWLMENNPELLDRFDPSFLAAIGYQVTLQLTIVVIAWLYLSLFEASPMQASPGKRFVGAKVTDENGTRISFARANTRFFGKFLSMAMLGIGFLMIAFTSKKQAMHDKMAHCLVVRR